MFIYSGIFFLFFLFCPHFLQAAGAGLAYVGHYVIKSFGSFDSLIQNKSTLIPAAIIIGISAVMFFVGIVGCCSTLRESKCGLSFVSVCEGIRTRRDLCLNHIPNSLMFICSSVKAEGRSPRANPYHLSYDATYHPFCYICLFLLIFRSVLGSKIYISFLFFHSF